MIKYYKEKQKLNYQQNIKFKAFSFRINLTNEKNN